MASFFQADLMFGRPGAYLSGASFDVLLSGLAILANIKFTCKMCQGIYSRPGAYPREGHLKGTSLG